MADRPVVALDVGVLLRLAGLDVGQRNALLLGPGHQRGIDVFGAVVDPDGQWLAAPFDNLVQGSNDPFGRQREVDLDAKPFAIEVVPHVQEPELSPVGQAIGHEIHGPDQVGRLRHGLFIGLLALEPSPQLDPQAQFQLTAIR